jgi:PEGA domain
MFRYLKIPALVLAGLVIVAQSLAAQRLIVRPYFSRPYYVQPYYSPYYGWGYWNGPGWGYPGRAYAFPRANTGEVKIVTQIKDAPIYVDGGYAGVTGKLKHFDLPPGNHDIELRDPSGHTIYQERVQVILGRTTEIRMNP